MELDLTPDQEDLRDNVRSVLAEVCPMTFVREITEQGSSSTPVWSQMVELGWPALTVPEDLGGLGLGPVELALVLEEMGRVVAPGPFLATTTQFLPAVLELGTADQRARFAGAVAEGSPGTLALFEPTGGLSLHGLTTTATETADGLVLDGEKVYVANAAEADEIVVVARLAGGEPDALAACVVARSDLVVEPISPFDRTRPLARIVLDGVAVPADRVLGTPGTATTLGVQRVVHHAAAGVAMESVGTCQSIFDITLDYAKQREQFGVPIGSFQAVKHKFADMVIALEKARATSYFAALTLAEDDARRELATSSAKVASADCEKLMSKEGIQLHGGIGYTWEHDMHLYVRRAKSDTLFFGGPGEHRERVARALGL